MGVAVAEHRAALVEVQCTWTRYVAFFIDNCQMTERKHTRHTSSGTPDDHVYLQINSETDFVAKNERFKDLVRSIAKTALQSELPVATGTCLVLVSCGAVMHVCEYCEAHIRVICRYQ